MIQETNIDESEIYHIRASCKIAKTLITHQVR